MPRRVPAVVGASWGSGKRGWCAACAASTAVHVAGVAVLACVVSSELREEPEVVTLLTAIEAEPAAVEEFVSVTPAPQAEATDEPSLPGGTRADVLLGVPEPPPQPADHLLRPGGTGASRRAVGAKAGTAARSATGSLTGALALGSGSGNGAGDGDGDGSGRGFFGIQAEGTTFVYVVDCSGSMNAQHPGAAKTRFGRLKLEILKSVSSLEEHQRFYIVFFNHAAVPMPSQTLQPATAEAKQFYLDWMSRTLPHGDTDPTEALSLALRLQPDVIYFLTDGSFSKGTIWTLRKMRQNRSRIHTFAFGDPSGERLMKEIAAENGGEYHFIPGDE